MIFKKFMASLALFRFEKIIQKVVFASLRIVERMALLKYIKIKRYNFENNFLDYIK